MTKLPGKSILPFSPTQDESGSPTVCKCCGMLRSALDGQILLIGQGIKTLDLCVSRACLRLEI